MLESRMNVLALLHLEKHVLRRELSDTSKQTTMVQNLIVAATHELLKMRYALKVLRFAFAWYLNNDVEP